MQPTARVKLTQDMRVQQQDNDEAEGACNSVSMCSGLSVVISSKRGSISFNSDM